MSSGDAVLTGSVAVQSGSDGSIKVKMGTVNPPHAIVLHDAGVKIFSRAGGIRILHGASAKFEEMEAATAPRKIVIESRDAPIEILGSRLILKAEESLRLECGANFFELSQAGLTANQILETKATDGIKTEMDSVNMNGP